MHLSKPKLSKNCRRAFMFSTYLFFFLYLSGCSTDDLCKCTIMVSGDDEVYEDTSIEECQEIFGDTAGASGWEWDPNDC